MHVAYFSPAWPPGDAANGIVTYVQQIRAELLRLGHDVTVVSQGRAFTSDGQAVPLDWSQPLRERIIAKAGWIGLRTRRLPRGGGILARAFRQVNAMKPIDVIEMEESFGWSAEVQAGLEVPVVTRLHGPYFLTRSNMFDKEDERLSRRRVEAEGRAIRNATALSSPSTTLMQLVADRYGSDARWKAVIPNPVTPAPADRLWRLDDCDPHAFLLVGRFDRAKGADVALKAMELVLAREPRATLTIVGPDKGIELENGRLAHFEEYCTASVPSNVRAAVRFLGPIERDAIDPLRRRSIAALICSRFESFSYAVVEAMALGLSVIATDSCNGELMVDGETGWLIPIGSVEALADAMLKVLGNPEHAAAVGRAGWQSCKDHAAADVVSARTIDFYRDVCAGFRSR